MPSYNIPNSSGDTIATIGVATTTGNNFPIQLIGQGISLYGPTIATTQYHLLENFASTTPPTNPVEGMFWYNKGKKSQNFYDGVQFIPLSGLTTNSSALFNMLPTATGIDLTVAATIPLFTDPNVGDSFHATGMMLKTSGTPGATSPAIMNLLISASEDVMENISVSLTQPDTHAFYPISGTTASATGGTTIQLEILTPATGGALAVDAYLFGFKT